MSTTNELQTRCQSIANDIENPPTVTEEDVEYNPDLTLGDTIYAYEYLSEAFRYKL